MGYKALSKKNRRLLFASLVAFAVLLSFLPAAYGQALAARFEGNATIGGTIVGNGTVVEAFLGGQSAANRSATTLTYNPITGSARSVRYSVDVACPAAGTAVFLKVWGINATNTTCSPSGFDRVNLSVNLTANGASCSYANACSGGYCCSGATVINTSGGSGTCQASVCAAAAAPVDTGGGGGGAGAGGGGAAAPAPAPPSQETIDVVKAALPEAFKEADAAGNVEIKTVAAPEVKEVPVAAETVTKTLEQLETIVKTEEAKQALNAIQEAVSSGGATTVAVKKTIEVVKATNKVTKEEVIVSVVKLSVTAPGNQELKNVEVVEVIPKAAASNVNQVTFKGDQPQVLEADPVVKWFFAQVSKGTSKDLSYVINKDIRNIGTSTVAVQGRAEAAPPAVEAPPAPPVGEKEEAAPPVEVKKPTPVNAMILVVVMAVVVVAGWFFVKSRRTKVAK